ncbi:hypothetical protein M514_06461 [Trichuris suis]|uniref:HTH psq-type domain-containing protein n=1 Tax=Trichuris suis TaxID=68888 RepID=A0A085N216_9BILA|nr:hypothetical protein M514_06461 [Trichuris suis]
MVEEKLEVLKGYQRTGKTSNIVKAAGIKESTLRTIRCNAETIERTCLSGTRPGGRNGKHSQQFSKCSSPAKLELRTSTPRIKFHQKHET